MELDPQISPYKTSDKTSFAYTSAKDRWPVIIKTSYLDLLEKTSAIDDIHRTTGISEDEVAIKEGKSIVEQLATLKYELQHNRQLKPLVEDEGHDIEQYNRELEELGTPTWFDVPWLFCECYLYRRISTLFKLSTKWRHYDVFSRQKLSTFKSSRPAVLELAARYKDLIGELSSPAQSKPSAEEVTKAEEALFTEMCEICLWGNATDLSLLTNLSYEDIQKLQGSSTRKASQSKIVANDLPAAFADLKRLQKEDSKEERRVDIALDNAGFELFVDLILAGYLIASGLATTIVLHPKSMPWFVSDTIPADFVTLLNAMANPQKFYSEISDENSDATQTLSDEEIANLNFLFDSWSEMHAEGQLIIRPNEFWTLPGSYWRMPTISEGLYSDLKQSNLVIFKGDLHYRKLTGDVAWPPTTPFRESIGPLGEKEGGLKVLALRTCKADVITGLPEGEDERLKNTDGGGGDTGARKWAWSGQWAVVQYSG